MTRTILLVEDNEDDVLFVKIALEKCGIAVALRVAVDGSQAIEYLSGRGDYADRSRHPLPALVLLDVELPRVMGMEVLKWIREQREFDLLQIVMLTLSQKRSDIAAACALRANSYLVKPANPLELSEMIELVNRYWFGLNQPSATYPTFAGINARS